MQRHVGKVKLGTVRLAIYDLPLVANRISALPRHVQNRVDILQETFQCIQGPQIQRYADWSMTIGGDIQTALQAVQTGSKTNTCMVHTQMRFMRTIIPHLPFKVG